MKSYQPDNTLHLEAQTDGNQSIEKGQCELT